MSMLDNAVSSIRLGVEDFQAAEADEARALSAIRNLTAGLLLLFKVKLQELSPEDSGEALLKVKILPVIGEDGSPTWVGKGGKTVDVQMVEERLKSLGVIGVDWKQLVKLTTIRNDVEHYYSNAPVSLLLQAMAASFHLIQQFVPRYLEQNPVDLLGESVWEFLTEQEAFYERELAECRDALQTVQWPLQAVRDSISEMVCSECQSQLIRPEDASVLPPATRFLCTKCAASSDYDELVEAALAEHFAGYDYLAVTQGGEPAIEECYECGRQAFVIAESHCAACLVENDAEDCVRCGGAMTRQEAHLYGSHCGYCDYVHEKMMEDD